MRWPGTKAGSCSEMALTRARGATVGSPEKKLASVSIRRREARSAGIMAWRRRPGGPVAQSSPDCLP